MDEKQLVEEIQKRAQDGKIACRQCFDIAKEYNISLKTVGRLCNENRVKIHACQLGCFK